MKGRVGWSIAATRLAVQARSMRRERFRRVLEDLREDSQEDRCMREYVRGVISFIVEG